MLVKGALNMGSKDYQTLMAVHVVYWAMSILFAIFQYRHIQTQEECKPKENIEADNENVRLIQEG